MSSLRPSHSECLYEVPRFKGPQNGWYYFRFFLSIFCTKIIAFLSALSVQDHASVRSLNLFLHWNRKCIKLALPPAITLRNMHFATKCVYVFRIILKVNYDYFPQHDLPTGMYNGYGLCCEAGTFTLKKITVPSACLMLQ
jgi:hypothetical protein